tara:strand:- start:258 stop:548 length:291 start_codon:yes stop_codon:yes gene_type:complete
MSKKLDKDNPNRWVLITNENEGADSLFSFGNGGEQGVTIVETGQPNLVSFFTEEELEEAVNTIALDPAYYKNAVEAEDGRFLPPSQLHVYGLKRSH